MADIFPRVSFFRQGYDPKWVDSFFVEARGAYEGGVPAEVFSAENVRKAAFPLVRGGYASRAVDSALSRLENAFIQRDRVDFIAVNTEADWFAKVTEEATVLYPRLLRPLGERFSHPTKRTIGYKATEVDALLDRLTSYFDDQGSLTADEVRYAVFSPARGEKAYDEAQVDAYLSKTIQILLAVA